VSYATSGSHAISVTYGGDANFAGSASGSVTVPVQLLGTLRATMRWSFITAARYTRVLTLLVTGAQTGSSVLISCRGGGCPFSNTVVPVSKTRRCGPKSKRTCPTNGVVDLTSRFAKHRLRPLAKITVEIVRPGWIGKTYTFVVQAHRAPRTSSACLAPDARSARAC
jgi:hypothetical protein